MRVFASTPRALGFKILAAMDLLAVALIDFRASWNRSAFGGCGRARCDLAHGTSSSCAVHCVTKVVERSGMEQDQDELEHI